MLLSLSGCSWWWAAFPHLLVRDPASCIFWLCLRPGAFTFSLSDPSRRKGRKIGSERKEGRRQEERKERE